MEIINTALDTQLIDSVSCVFPKIEVVAQTPVKSIIEHIYSASTVVIALVNVSLVFYIFSKNNKKDDDTNEKNRKINLLKTLVLDYNISKFYEFFTNVGDKTKLVNKNNVSMSEKAKINDEINDLATDFRQSFIDLFIAIDKNLYDEILRKTDSLIDGLTNTIFDEGINLAHKPKFDEAITKEIRQSKTDIIRTMFLYSGV